MNLRIAIDFDGTIKLPNEYETPLENTFVSYGFNKVYEWGIRHGIDFILWTCRNLEKEKELNFVCDFLNKNELQKIYIPLIELGSEVVCRNLKGEEIKIFSSGSRKIDADLFIDNKGAGTPFIKNFPEQIDWTKMLSIIKDSM